MINNIFLVIGFIGQAFFSMRFIIQWIYSESKKKSIIPMSFWYLSIIGSLLLTAYAIYRKDPVFIAGYFFNSIVYIRNIILTNNEQKSN